MRSAANLLLLFGAAAMGASFLLGGHYPPWTTFEQQVSASVGAALWAMAALVQGGRALPVPRLAALFGLLSAVPAFQYLGGQIVFHSDAIISAGYILAFAVSILVGHVLGSREFASQDASPSSPLTILLVALLIAATMSAAGGLWQWQGLPAPFPMGPNLSGDRISANLAQPNHLATLLLWGTVAAIYLAAIYRWSPWTLSSLMVLLGLGLVMTQSRAGMVGALTLSVWCAWKGRLSTIQVSRRAIVIAVLLLCLALLSWASVNRSLFIGGAGDLTGRLQPGYRLIHWATLLDATFRHPWLGYGWNQVSLAQWTATLEHPASTEWLMQSHNLVLDLAIYNGWPITFLICGSCGLWLVRQAGACRTPSQWALLAALFVLLLHAMVEYPHDYAFFLLPAGLMIGFLNAQNADSVEHWRVPRPVLTLLVLGLCALLLVVTLEYLDVQSAHRDLRFHQAGYTRGGRRVTPPPDVYLLDQPREFHRFIITPARTGMTIDELRWMQSVVERRPEPPAMLRLALAMGLNNRPGEAQSILRRLCKIQRQERCDEGRSAWATAQKTFPQLNAVPFPNDGSS